MRVRKFRAWDKEKKIMCDVFNIQFDLGYVGIKAPNYCVFEREIGKVILMDYTGLKDKDNKEIWEGDIVIPNGSCGEFISHPYGGERRTLTGEKAVVLKLDVGFVLRHISCLKYPLKDIYTPNMILEGWEIFNNYDLWNLQKSLEVIGNIFDNKELLEGEK